MKAMILAAGFGTRLGTLTAAKPKALVELAGRPLLEHAITRLKDEGFDEIIINVHHFAEQIIRFIAEKESFGIRIDFSHETDILNTGGGLKKAAHFFDDGQSFLLYNTDILSNIQLQDLKRVHHEKGALVTLAVRGRTTSRYFLFDQNRALIGWKNVKTGETLLMRDEPGMEPQALSFMGIHFISPDIFPLLHENGAFSIVDAYLRLCKEGHKLYGYPADQCDWLDLGRPENLQEAEAMLAHRTSS